MAYITTEELKTRLPLDGEGVSDDEIDEAIASAVEYVAALTGDTDGEGAVARAAVAQLAHADVLDIIYPRDARSTDAQSVIMRQNVESMLKRYFEALADDDSNLTTTPSVAYLESAPW
jgi:hypothetical protein